MQGIKVRVMNNDMFVTVIESLGGDATPMAFAEGYPSLKTGIVDGARNNQPSHDGANRFEVAKHHSISGHLIIPECLCMSKMTGDRLPPDDQAIVMAAGRASADLQRTLWQAPEKKSMETAGAAVNQIADKAQFQAAMTPVHDRYPAERPDLTDLANMLRDAD